MTVNIPEILVADLSGAIMMLFLLLVSVRNCDAGHTSERLFNGMLLTTLVALIAETGSFLLDGQVFPGSVFLLFLTNTLCTGLTVTVGFLWCLFVNSHIYHSGKRLARKAVILGIPLAVIYVLLFANLFGNGIIFRIQEDGVYERGSFNFLLYLALGIYFIESIADVHISQREGISLFFFPVYYFVIPCIIGTIIQGLCYGLATGWFSTAVACVFVNIELQTGNAFIDGTSGLFNREYMNYYLKRAANVKAKLYGIMIDINDFKAINDTFGHAVGDSAIFEMGRILSRSVSHDSVAMRMSGDEFVIFINNGSKQKLDEQEREIEENLHRFNESGAAPYRLSISVGTGTLVGKTVEQFLSEMDYAMYMAKRAYHKLHDRRS